MVWMYREGVLEMAIKISISNSMITEDARVLNNARISDSGDIGIDIYDTKINGRAVVWENLSVEPVLNELNQKAEMMDRNSREFEQIQRIIEVKNWNKKEFIRCIAKHVAEFSQGVLASVIANYIT